MYQVEFSPHARKEILESRKWYEEQQFGLGERFQKSVLKNVEKIRKYPLLRLVKYSSYREFQMKNFPFLIIYRIKEKLEKIFINSVFHVKRNPKSKY